VAAVANIAPAISIGAQSFINPLTHHSNKMPPPCKPY
jgi:hypothetical protein